jgi:hypothetical protein
MLSLPPEDNGLRARDFEILATSGPESLTKHHGMYENNPTILNRTVKKPKTEQWVYGMIIRYLLQLSAHVTINICYLEMFPQYVSAPTDHVRGDNLHRLIGAV